MLKISRKGSPYDFSHDYKLFADIQTQNLIFTLWEVDPYQQQEQPYIRKLSYLNLTYIRCI